MVDLENDPKTSVQETEQLKDVVEKTKERQSYNGLYEEALPIVKNAYTTGEDMEKDIYFSSIEKNYRKAQAAFEECAKNASACTEEDRDKRMREAKKALRAFNASLDVKFKAEEAAKQEELVPEKELTEDEVDDIVDKFLNFRKLKEGYEFIENELKAKYK